MAGGSSGVRAVTSSEPAPAELVPDPRLIDSVWRGWGLEWPGSGETLAGALDDHGTIAGNAGVGEGSSEWVTDPVPPTKVQTRVFLGDREVHQAIDAILAGRPVGQAVKPDTELEADEDELMRQARDAAAWLSRSPARIAVLEARLDELTNALKWCRGALPCSKHQQALLDEILARPWEGGPHG